MDFLTMPFFTSFDVTEQVTHPYETTGKWRFCVFYCLYLRQQKDKTDDSGPKGIGNSVYLMCCYLLHEPNSDSLLSFSNAVLNEE